MNNNIIDEIYNDNNFPGLEKLYKLVKSVALLLPTNFSNIILIGNNLLIALSIAFSNVEKNVFSQKSEELVNGFEKQQRNTQGMLADSLLHGEITQEVKNLRWRTYKILKKSKKALIFL
mgnify:CR=1 FL=1